MAVLDRWGKPVDQPKERQAIGFVDRTMPDPEDFDVITGITPTTPTLPLTSDNDRVQAKRR